jgi:hypothetical protein
MRPLLWVLVALSLYRITAGVVRIFTGAPRRPLMLSQIALGGWAGWLLVWG